MGSLYAKYGGFGRAPVSSQRSECKEPGCHNEPVCSCGYCGEHHDTSQLAAVLNAMKEKGFSGQRLSDGVQKITVGALEALLNGGGSKSMIESSFILLLAASLITDENGIMRIDDDSAARIASAFPGGHSDAPEESVRDIFSYEL